MQIRDQKAISIFISTSVSIMINSWYTYIYILPPIWLPHYWNTGRCIEPSAKSLRVLASSCCVDDQFFFPKKRGTLSAEKTNEDGIEFLPCW